MIFTMSRFWKSLKRGGLKRRRRNARRANPVVFAATTERLEMRTMLSAATFVGPLPVFVNEGPGTGDARILNDTPTLRDSSATSVGSVPFGAVYINEGLDDADLTGLNDTPALGHDLLETLEFGEFQADDSDRWTTTATDGSGLQQGDATTLTWSIVPDGTFIGGFNGEPASNSDLVDVLGDIYGVTSANTFYTDEPWYDVFVDIFDRWEQLTGIRYDYEPNDDGVALVTGGVGEVNVRGDIRIGGHVIDGESGPNVLAYNFFPNNGDMVIDTSNSNFYSNTSNNSLNMRNVLSHEHGHGLGISHVLSDDANFLMEPFIDTSFDGPQYDDILAGQRLYGDTYEFDGNETTSTAVDLGTVPVGGNVTIGADGTTTNVAATASDIVSIDDDADIDVFSFTLNSVTSLDITLTPVGPTYQQGPQGNPPMEPPPQTTFNASAQSDLVLELIDTNGSTVLQTVDLAGVGSGETISGVVLAAGTYYVRVTGKANMVQTYQLTVSDETTGPALTVSIDPSSISENGGTATGTVTRDSTSGNLTVFLTSSDETEATVPASVVIPDGSASITFPITGIDDALVDGTQTVTITASTGTTAVPDSSFGTSGVAVTSLRNNISYRDPEIAVQPDGKVLAIGRHPTAEDSWQLTRINVDGTLDAGFGSGGTATTQFASHTNVRPTDVVLHPDGKITLIGRGGSSRLLARYNSDGTPDTSFGSAGRVIFAQPPAGFTIYNDGLLNADGSMTLFGQTGGDLLVSRILADGNLDATFGTGGDVVHALTPGGTDTINDVVRQPDGKFVITGVSILSGDVRYLVARLHPDGSLDTSFDSDGFRIIDFGVPGQVPDAVALQSDGKILIFGSVGTLSGTNWGLARLNTDGSLDATFGTGGMTTFDLDGNSDFGHDLLVRPDGKILAVGSLSKSGSSRDRGMVQFNPDGSVDASFADNGVFLQPPLGVTFEEIWDAELTPTGELVTFTGYVEDFQVERFLLPAPLSGAETIDVTDDDAVQQQLVVTIDPASFNENGGTATGTVTRTGSTTGDLTVFLSSSDESEATVPVSVTILNGDSSANFTITGVDDLIVDGTQTVTITATAEPVVPGEAFYLDETFGGTGIVEVDHEFAIQFPEAALAVQLDGKIIGVSEHGDGLSWRLTRTNPDGTPDTTFDTDGVAVHQIVSTPLSNPVPFDVVVQADGKILVGGRVNDGSGSAEILARFNVDGSLDTSFATDGIAENFLPTSSNGWVSEMAVLEDGKIVVAIDQTGSPMLRVARLLSSGVLDTTFGDAGDNGEQTLPGTGFSQALTVQPDGKILVAGDAIGEITVTRLNADGTFDFTFGSSFGTETVPAPNVAFVNGIRVQSDGSVVVGLSAEFDGTNWDPGAFRLTSSGVLDTTYGTGGIATIDLPDDNVTTSMVMHENGAITLGGYTQDGSGDRQLLLVRFTADGAPDTTIGAGGVHTQSPFSSPNEFIFDLGLAPDGTLVALEGWSDFRLLRYHSGFELTGSDTLDVTDDEVGAQTFLVDTLVDESDGDFSTGDLSLREAVELANLSVGADTIQFDPLLTGTIALGGTELLITDDVTITGLGSTVLTVSGNDASRIFHIDGVTSGPIDVEISGLTLTGGLATASGDNQGGAILNDGGNLTLTHSSVTASTATIGGGIATIGGSLTIEETTISGNTGTVFGGGIRVASGDLTLTNVVLDANVADSGGGLHAFATAADPSQLTLTGVMVTGNMADFGAGIELLQDGVTLTLIDSEISGNQALSTGAGGGLLAQLGADVTITGSTITNNTAGAGGGLAIIQSDLRLENSTVSDNDAGNVGGGIAFSDTAGSTAMTIVGSTISGNTTDVDGGGVFIQEGGTHTIINSTISGNAAAESGGGIENLDGTLVIRSSTITGNRADLDGVDGDTGGGISLTADAGTPQATLHNTIVAGNFAGASGSDDPDDVNSGTSDTLDAASTHNLIGHAATAGGLTDGSNGNIVGIGGTGTIDITAVLDTTLADNGGPTLTHALVPASLAVDAGNNTHAVDELGNPLTTDQRQTGFARVLDGDGDFTPTVDIGAFEADTLPALMVTIDPASISENGGTATGMVTRNTGTSGPLEVTLASDDTTEATVPTVVTIPDGSDSVTFTITAFDDFIVDGTQTVTITATAGGFTAGTDTLDVTDDDTGPVTFMVDTLSDVSDGVFSAGNFSLREAIDLANQSLGADTIEFDTNLAGGTITLSGTQLRITDDLTITGLGSANLTIDGNDASGIFHIEAEPPGPINVEIYALALTGGSAIRGGAIFNDSANVTLGSSDIIANTAGLGGGLASINGSFAIVDTFFSINVAGSAGGAIYNGVGNEMTITDSILRSNSISDDVNGGGGIWNGGLLTVVESTLLGNSSKFRGGGIYNFQSANNAQSGYLTVIGSTLSLNNASLQGGGLHNQNGVVIVKESTLRDNAAMNAGGGAISNSGGQMTVVNSTLRDNSAARFGGGILTQGVDPELTVINSTLSGNTADMSGGGISVFAGTAQLINSTIVLNRAGNSFDDLSVGGGVHGQGSTTLHNTIVAGNIARTESSGDTPGDLGDINFDTASSHNLIGDAATAGGLSHNTNGNIVGNSGSGTIDITTVLVTTLTDNGGPTLTHALVAGSLALDAGDDTEAVDENSNPLLTDQRGSGFARILDGDGDFTLAVDIGAFEADTLPALMLTIDEDSISENGGSSTATVTRNTPTIGELVVTLLSSDTTEATVQGTVTILDGQSSATFTITGENDMLVDGTQLVTITASASGFTDGADTIDVTDDDAVSPVLLSSAVNGGADNRSGIGLIEFTFSEAVTIASAESFQLLLHTGTGSTSASLAGAVLVNNGTSLITLDLTGLTTPLADGQYTLELPTSEATSGSGVPLAQTYATAFHKLLGDVNGNGAVSNSDYIAVQANFGSPVQPFGPGDANGNGVVSNSDYIAVQSNFGMTVDAVEFDFGDVADSAQTPTLLASDGSRHVITGNSLWLGDGRDAEVDGQPSADATGDDTAGSDDEDGIVVGDLEAGSSVPVVVNANASGPAFLNGWIDFNRDGDWDDAGEQVFVDQPISDGANNLVINVPAGADTGMTLARFRLTETEGYSWFGLAPSGEVEDYQLNVVAASSTLAAQELDEPTAPNWGGFSRSPFTLLGPSWSSPFLSWTSLFQQKPFGPV